MKTEDIKTLTERHKALVAECEKLGAEIERLNAGGDDWPKEGDSFWSLSSAGTPEEYNFDSSPYDVKCKARGNVYRTKQAAREADEQIQFLRRAMTAGDLAPDAVGYGIYMSKGGYPTPFQYEGFDCFRKFSTMEARDAFIKSEGGIEVFRARLAKGWPV